MHPTDAKCVEYAKFLFVCSFVIIYIGILEFNKFSTIREETCTTTGFKDKGNELIFSGYFELRDGSQKNWTITLQCSGHQCNNLIDKYGTNLSFTCYWYPNVNVMSVYSTEGDFSGLILGPGIALMLISGLIIGIMKTSF